MMLKVYDGLCTCSATLLTVLEPLGGQRCSQRGATACGGRSAQTLPWPHTLAAPACCTALRWPAQHNSLSDLFEQRFDS